MQCLGRLDLIERPGIEVTSVADTMATLGRFLAEFRPTRTSDGTYVIRRGTAVCNIWATESGPDTVVVHFEAPVVFEAPLTTELLEFAASGNGDPAFQSYVVIHDGEKAILALRYALRGEYLRATDVTHAAQYLVEVADLIDEGAQSRFGGLTAGDYFR